MAAVAPSPLSPQAVSGVELKAQLEAERDGAPFLLLRDATARQQVRVLEAGSDRVTVGRRASCGLCLEWDEEVSRVHAAFERVDEEWTLVDDGLSRNGTFVNGERVTGRRRLHDGDTIRVGTTIILFRRPSATAEPATAVAGGHLTPASLTDTQRRVLVALCRPFKTSGGFATPATNQQIAEEVFLGVDAVKTHLRALFDKFDVGQLPQNQKRARLVERAFLSGLVSERDL